MPSNLTAAERSREVKLRKCAGLLDELAADKPRAKLSGLLADLANRLLDEADVIREAGDERGIARREVPQP
jgi:hypothetical protein